LEIVGTWGGVQGPLQQEEVLPTLQFIGACAILTKDVLTRACPVKFLQHIFSFILCICNKIIKTNYTYFGVLI